MTQISIPNQAPKRKQPSNRGRFIDFAPKKNQQVSDIKRPVSVRATASTVKISTNGNVAVRKVSTVTAAPAPRPVAKQIVKPVAPAKPAAKPVMHHGVSADFLAAQKRLEQQRLRRMQAQAIADQKNAEAAEKIAAAKKAAPAPAPVVEEPVVEVVEEVIIAPEPATEGNFEDVSPLSDDELRSALADFEMLSTDEDDEWASDEPVEESTEESTPVVAPEEFIEESEDAESDYNELLDDFAETSETDLIDDTLDELENELDSFAAELEQTQEDFISNPEPFAAEQELSDLLSDFADSDKEESEEKVEEAPKKRRPIISPFLKTVTVDKRPLSGDAEATPVVSTSSVVAESISDDIQNFNKPAKNSYEKSSKEKKNKEKKTKKDQPTLVVDKAEHTASATNGLLLIIAIILTIIFGAVVGAILYLALFQ